MAKPRLRFIKRRGHDLTIRDDAGQKHKATLTKLEEEAAAVREEGSFAFGYCKSCDWVGPGRRARGKAKQDAVAHMDECDGKGRIRIGVSDS